MYQREGREGRHLVMTMSSRTQGRQGCLEGQVCGALQRKLKNSQRQPGAIPECLVGPIGYGCGFRGQARQVLPDSSLGLAVGPA